MTQDLVAFDPEDVSRLARNLKAFEQGRFNVSPTEASPSRGAPVETWIGQTTSTITALSGTTAGSGTVELYNLSSGTLTDQTLSVTAYNLGAATISSSEWVTMIRDPISGNFVITSVGSGSIVPGGGGSSSCLPCAVACSNCVGGLAAKSFTLTSSGFTNGACSSCGSYNGTFTLNWISSCEWQTTATDPCGSGLHMWTLQWTGTEWQVTCGTGGVTYGLASWDCMSCQTFAGPHGMAIHYVGNEPFLVPTPKASSACGTFASSVSVCPVTS